MDILESFDPYNLAHLHESDRAVYNNKVHNNNVRSDSQGEKPTSNPNKSNKVYNKVKNTFVGRITLERQKKVKVFSIMYEQMWGFKKQTPSDII